MPDDKPSFITTLPGLLTGLAALITALGGLAVLFSKHDSTESLRQPSSVASHPSSSHAPSAGLRACGMGGPRVTDPSGRPFSMVYCDVFANADAHASADSSSPVVGTVLPGRQVVACQKQGAENPTSRNADGKVNHNTWWLWTQAAPGQATAWGWIPATFVMQGGDYDHVPGVAFCPDGASG